jgi:chromosome segregation ATPase
MELYGNEEGTGDSRIDALEAVGAQANVIESVVAATGAKLTATKEGKVVTIDDAALVADIVAAKKAGTDAQGTADAAVAAAAEADRKAVAAQGTADTNTENIDKLTTRVTALDTATTGRVAVVEGKVSTLEGQVTNLQGATGTNAQNITNINTKIGTTAFEGDTLTGAIKSLQTNTSENETNISGLDGRLTTAEGKVTTLEGDMTKAKTDIIAAKKAGDDAMAYAKDTVKPIADEAKATAEQNTKDITTINGNLSQLTTKVTTIETTYQTKANAEAQHKEITDDIAELQAALGTGGTGADSITSRLTTAEADIDKLQ